jgi:hypothetical protein
MTMRDGSGGDACAPVQQARRRIVKTKMLRSEVIMPPRRDRRGGC